MLKRFGPWVIMAAGVVVLAAAFGYWRFTEAVANPTAVLLPETLAGLPLSQATYGAQAVAEVTRLHGKAFPVSSGAAAMYGGHGAMVMLWVSGAPVAPVAARMVTAMEAAIAEGDSPFTPVGVREIGGRSIYELTGMGQRHFYFQSAALVVWLAADESIAEEAIAAALAFYP